MFWRSAMLRLKRWDDYREAKLKNRVFLVFLPIRAVKILFFNFRLLSTSSLFIALLLSLSAVLQTIKRSLTSFFRSTSLSASLIASLPFSTNCWKFRIAYSSTRIIILSISTQLYSLLVVPLRISLVTSTPIAKGILITLSSPSKFSLFCEAFIRTKTRSTMLEESTKLSKCDSIRSLMSFF